MKIKKIFYIVMGIIVLLLITNFFSNAIVEIVSIGLVNLIQNESFRLKGKVIGEDGNAIAKAEISVSVYILNGWDEKYEEKEIETDEKGFFKISEKGAGLEIFVMAKGYYPKTCYFNKKKDIPKGLFVIKLNKKGPQSILIGGRAVKIRIPKEERKSVGYDFIKGKIIKGGKGADLNIRIEHGNIIIDGGESTEFKRFIAPKGEKSEHAMRKAPEDGYVKKIFYPSIDLNNQNFYIKVKNGKFHGKAYNVMITPLKSKISIRFNYAIQPDGTRHLEGGVRKPSSYKKRLKYFEKVLNKTQ
jgi:hypothetical protein